MRKFLMIFLCLLIPATSASGDSILLSSDALFSEMVSCGGKKGEAALQVSLMNNTQEAMDVYLFEPLFNGCPASFGTGQTSLKIGLQPYILTKVDFSICADDPSVIPENVSFRYCFHDNITSRTTISIEDQSCVPAQSYLEEQIIIANVSTPNVPLRYEPILLTDSFDVADVPLLDYAQVLVFLREEESLRLLTILPADVDPNGNASAIFSNYLLALDGESPFLLSTEERTENGETIWLNNRISLYGDSIYFAVLTLKVLMSQESVQVIQQSLEAAEFGFSVNAPYALFNEGTASCLQYQIEEENETAIPVISNAVTKPITINEQLQLLLMPTEGQGELVYYFEYFFTNGEYLVHPAFPVNYTSQGD